MFDYQLQNELDVYRCKDDWRRNRAEIINKTATKYREFNQTSAEDPYLNNKYIRMLTEPNESTI
jgi:hypothetical protein